MPDSAPTDLAVLVIGEVLVEIAGREPLDERAAATLALLAPHCAVVVTRGALGSLVASGPDLTDVPVVPALEVVDQTGAGDSMTGMLCARLAAGDDQIRAHRAAHSATARLATQGASS